MNSRVRNRRRRRLNAAISKFLEEYSQNSQDYREIKFYQHFGFKLYPQALPHVGVDLKTQIRRVLTDC